MNSKENVKKYLPQTIIELLMECWIAGGHMTEEGLRKMSGYELLKMLVLNNIDTSFKWHKNKDEINILKNHIELINYINESKKELDKTIKSDPGNFVAIMIRDSYKDIKSILNKKEK